ncbi:hypothetical protein SPRG_04044 [Saprolegnia parasitica CBS 223.65]|uniref:Methyltransferase domain-containing protein n=1 Tax=Saprolegnia parasitica (strain CBS 223.65) TaxID=695850 RepID=A0A067CL37_SAPPC|nr:hypothetical protein SPRG_04044 [Saprolegnia parasitica CBS 223.65]KDO31429.1 hypothetical protein SPRG_04044 [Saprolegnia parasitica CBS 223.65]|eukprot:XP_012198024.1 hypothetical protein SPRG_04044 [Saprolegnia parasitica CBS 223.65]
MQAHLATAAAVALALVVGTKLFRGRIYDLLIVQLTAGWYKAVLDDLPATARVLDVGIGTGQALLQNLELVREKAIIVDGVDYDADYVADCRANIARVGCQDVVAVQHASIYDFAPATTYGAIYFSASLMIMPDPVAALRHCAAFLTPGGHIYVTQTIQTRSSRIVELGKPLLKFFTTIDFGAATYEVDLLRTFQVARLNVLDERCLSGAKKDSARSYRMYKLAP